MVFPAYCQSSGSLVAKGYALRSSLLHPPCSSQMEITRVHALRRRNGVMSISFSSDGGNRRSGTMAAFGGVLAVGTQDGRFLVVVSTTGETRLDVQAHRTAVSCLVLSPDGSRVATASADRSLRVWDVSDGTQRLCVPGHDGKGACVCEPNGLQSWATIDAGCPVVGHARRVIAMAFATDGERVATGGQDNAVVVWNAGTGQALLRLLEQHTQPVCVVAFSSDGLKLASGSIGEKISMAWANGQGLSHDIVHLANADLVQDEAVKQRARVTALAFSLDGAALVSGSADKTVKIWEPGSGRLLLSLDVGVCVSSVTFGEDWVVGERRRERRVAFAMGWEGRLGGEAGCRVGLLKSELLRMVLDKV
ncbi:quinon protein alcohol dehydrogenase-like superfamily [Baffinella frigidus]|nr:quinon protein alcohol dehydrogenase-like superfamily [Cryptophyta sp. CCMP2293]